MTSAPPIPLHHADAKQPPTFPTYKQRGPVTNTTLTANVMFFTTEQNQFLLINNSYSVNICTARKMDGTERRKRGLRL